MKKQTYTCTKTQYNNAMGATMCYENDLIFFFDYSNMVVVGDVVTIERDQNHNTKHVWVNGEELTFNP